MAERLTGHQVPYARLAKRGRQTIYSDRVGLRFAWDEDKAEQNVENHGVSFEEAATVLGVYRRSATLPAETTIRYGRRIGAG